MTKLKALGWSFLVSLVSLLIALFLVAYNLSYYHDFQVAYQLSEETGKSQEELDRISQDIVGYLKDGDLARMEKHFSDRETAHMVDVFSLFRLAKGALLVGMGFYIAILLYAYKKKKSLPAKEILLGQALFLGLLALLAILAWQNWDLVFVGFHKLFFSNDLWLMNPKTDLMIQMLPTPFFVGMARDIGLRTLVHIGFLQALALILFDRSGKRAKHVSL